MLGISFILPESPRWRTFTFLPSPYIISHAAVIEHSCDAEGIRLLARLHPDSDPDHIDRFAKLQAYEIQKQHELDVTLRQQEGRFGLIAKKSNRKRLFVSCFILWSSQSMGVLVINNYSVSLYKSLGAEGSRALLLSAGWVTVTIPFNILAPFLIDRMGRKMMFREYLSFRTYLWDIN